MLHYFMSAKSFGLNSGVSELVQQNSKSYYSKRIRFSAILATRHNPHKSLTLPETQQTVWHHAQSLQQNHGGDTVGTQTAGNVLQGGFLRPGKASCISKPPL